ncbi:MAG: acetyl-CoA carboxylase biotin carboxylase subunit [Myxococcota bacterium]
MFKKVLIANRGEVAVLIEKVCRRASIPTVAVYSDADVGAPHVEGADEAVHIGGPRAVDSYANIDKLIEAARSTGAEAIHPGYGFLAESAAFSRACRDAGLVFVGPPPEVLQRVGDKAEARRVAREAGVPVVPGSEGTVTDSTALEIARSIGFPVLCKNVAGGGGIGITIARDDEELRAALCSNRAGPRQMVGDGALLLERYLERPRHIEVQVLSDARGTHLHLFERECSIQRRHQKMLEECPSPLAAVPEGTRILEEMYEAALRVASAVGYSGMGTIEFLLEGSDFYFIEMNPRLQVEHPCTELTTGIDMIGSQLAIAAGEALRLRQEDICRSGHVMELRICAEDPARGFRPSPGRIDRFEVPGGDGIRVDSGVRSGYTVSPFYDSMIAKLVAAGTNRAVALQRARAALDAFVVEGIKTNISVHQEILRTDAFVRGELSTRFIEDHLPIEARGCSSF